MNITVAFLQVESDILDIKQRRSRASQIKLGTALLRPFLVSYKAYRETKYQDGLVVASHSRCHVLVVLGQFVVRGAGKAIRSVRFDGDSYRFRYGK